MGESRAQTEKCRKQQVWNLDGTDTSGLSPRAPGRRDCSSVRALEFRVTTQSPGREHHREMKGGCLCTEALFLPDEYRKGRLTPQGKVLWGSLLCSARYSVICLNSMQVNPQMPS